MTEELKYEIIKKLVETNGNKKAAALKLNCTQRHVNRLIKGYLEEGKAFFQHGNKGRKPVNSMMLRINLTG
jgi:ribosomal protein L44E